MSLSRLIRTALVGAVVASAVAALHSGEIRPPGAAVLTELVEEFDDPKLRGWKLFGLPEPTWLEEAEGRKGIFDNSGDPQYSSGATSDFLVRGPKGFVLEAEVFVRVTDPTGCWLSADLGVTLDPNERPVPGGDDLGAVDDGKGIHIALYYVGDRCWADTAENRRHGWLSFSFQAEDGTAKNVVLPGDAYLNRWLRLTVEVDAKRGIRFLADGRVVFAPKERLHPDVLTLQRLVLGSRSAGVAGRAYHDQVRFRANP